ncbi:hypothetical protein amb2075 [Paramagnetospirillum magneticum AMB-1]|uniref:Uncharacterized protein n=1 Tax=Paramagnetospirillum magneticum (strain ATCC 700264 / AMB-1) TaxID=342108 RepID=Q2W5J6_PARM1|nr:hypothetical protein amb2075 [Paramagnetospirillum magneticum AMB-1]
MLCINCGKARLIGAPPDQTEKREIEKLGLISFISLAGIGYNSISPTFLCCVKSGIRTAKP